MQPARPSLPMRNDTILGVCEALGEDFGFHPNLLRVLFACVFYFSPLLVTGAYFGLGALVALSRWVFPTVVDSAPIVATPPVEHEKGESLKLAA